MIPIKKRRLTEEHEAENKNDKQVKEGIKQDSNKELEELCSKSIRIINLQHLVIMKMSGENQEKSHSKRKPFVTNSSELVNLDELEYKKMLHNSLKSKGLCGLKFDKEF